MAQRMTSDERREQILAAVVPPILEHGIAVTSRQLADAAGVAEGTLYRVFDNKHELLMAVFERETDAHLVVSDLASAEFDSLEDFVSVAIEALIIKFTRLRQVSLALGPLACTPQATADEKLDQLHVELAAAIEPFEPQLRVSRESAVEIIAALAFAAASRGTSSGYRATSDEVRSVLLRGLVVERGQPAPPQQAPPRQPPLQSPQPLRHQPAVPEQDAVPHGAAAPAAAYAHP